MQFKEDTVPYTSTNGNQSISNYLFFVLLAFQMVNRTFKAILHPIIFQMSKQEEYFKKKIGQELCTEIFLHLFFRRSYQQALLVIASVLSQYITIQSLETQIKEYINSVNQISMASFRDVLSCLVGYLYAIWLKTELLYPFSFHSWPKYLQLKYSVKLESMVNPLEFVARLND